jgi:hypothetical protein
MSFTALRLGSTTFIADAIRIISRICCSTSIGRDPFWRTLANLSDDVADAVKSSGPSAEVGTVGESCVMETGEPDRGTHSAAASLVDEVAGAMEPFREVS